MEITLNKIVQEKISIELPYYSKSTAFAYKVISQKTVITVGFTCSHKSIEVGSLNSTNALEKEAEQITEEEFWMLFNETKQLIYDTAIEKIN